MKSEKQITYINSLVADNRNVAYLAGDAPEGNKKEWIARSLNMPLYWPSDDLDEPTTTTASHYTLVELMAMRNAKIDEYEAMDDASKAIDGLKKMLGRR